MENSAHSRVVAQKSIGVAPWFIGALYGLYGPHQ
jgi:hypothetical protein